MWWGLLEGAASGSPHADTDTFGDAQLSFRRPRDRKNTSGMTASKVPRLSVKGKSMFAERLPRIQQQLQEDHVDGWLLYDFQGLNPIARRVAGVPGDRPITRRWACFIPAKGTPCWLVHAIERDTFGNVPGEVQVYVSWQQWAEGLRALVGNAQRIAMEYSPGAAVPTVSRVDAGTVELVRSLGVEVVSSADLVQIAEAVWSEEQLAAHRRAAAALMAVKDLAFGFVHDRLRARRLPTEVEVQQFILKELETRHLETDHPPIVAVNAHAADPHFIPTPENTWPIQPGSVLLVDLWARERSPHGVYADITWVAYTGSRPPARVQEVFSAVKAARDAALAFLEERVRSGTPVYGYEVDAVARDVLAKAGLAHAFLHRTGHSLGYEVHGHGVNLDSVETQDRRRILPGLGVTVEPGVYLPEEGFGIRLEVDVYVGESGVEITTLPLQDEIVLIGE